MVSSRKKFGVYFFISALVLAGLLMPAELKASQQCCKNGKLTTCPNLPNGQQYDLSGCQVGLGPVVDPDRPVIIDPDKPIIIGPIEAECTSGQTQYQPKGDCGTSSRNCCSDGTWSDWDGVCPAAPKQCTGTRPDSKTTCYGGKKRRTVSCNTSTGTWTTGSWGECDCSDSEFESVTTPSGGRCCQRKDGTGIKCAGALDLAGHRWVKAGTNCRSRVECGYGSCSGSCSTPGSECTTWVNNGMSAVAQGCAHYDTGDRGICQAYYCQ